MSSLEPMTLNLEVHFSAKDDPPVLEIDGI